MNFVCLNGKLFRADQSLFTAENRSFKYGDGIFETIKVYNGKMPFAELHFERLFSGLQMLNIQPLFTEAVLVESIVDLCQKNGCEKLGRVRLAAYREENNSGSFVIEANPLSEKTNHWNEKGFVIDLYPYARKSSDAFANLKSANFLPYVLAERYAKLNALDDCIVLNCDNHVSDASKANIFLIKSGEVFTPALHQGCVNGVMRRFLIDGMKTLNLKIHQQQVSEEDLLKAEEIFLTNAIYGMQWVSSFRGKNYNHLLSFRIYQQLLSSIYC